MSSEDIERRKRLESAVEDDDWSSVIDGQTKLTEDAKPDAEAPVATIIRSVPSHCSPHPERSDSYRASSGAELPYNFVTECFG